MSVKKKTKKKLAVQSVSKQMNKLLAHIIKRFIQTRRRRGKRAVAVAPKGTYPKGNQKKLAADVNKLAHGQFPAKITVSSTSDEKLVKEQARGQSTAAEDVKNKASKPVPAIMPPGSANSNNNNNQLITQTPHKGKSINIPNTPKKLVFDEEGSVTMKNARSGYEIKMSEAKAKEIFEDHKNVGRLREEANNAKDAEEKAKLEAKAAKLEKETLLKAKEASDKRLEKEIKRSHEEEIKGKQTYLKYDTVKDIYKYTTAQNLLQGKRITQKGQYLDELNTLPEFKQYFEDLALPDKTLNKTERDKFETNVYQEITDFIHPQQAGNGTKGALSNLQITEMMKNKDGFEGTFALNTLPKFDKEQYNFVVNTNPITDPTVGHWVSVRVDPTTIEYYDPLGIRPTPAMKKALSNAIGVNGNRQFKINRMQDQSIHSNNCGWFAMKFLDDRATGKKWTEATGFNKLGENQIKKYKLKYKDFSNI